MEKPIHPIRRWRKDRGLRLADLAKVVEITPSHLSEIEKGKNNASLALAAKISKVTGVSLEDIAKGVPA